MAKRICSVDGCERKHYAHGWCQRHYGRMYRNGDLAKRHPTGRPSVERAEVTCEGCAVTMTRRVTDIARNTSGRFFCSATCRNRIGVKPITVPERNCEQCGRVFRPLQRSVPGRFCTKKCYDAWQGRNRVKRQCEVCGEHFTLSPAVAAADAGRFCSKSCEARGIIRRPLDREYNGKPARLDDDGYVWVWEPGHPTAASYGGWMAEHRLVAEQVIGRPLTRLDQVHHINRIKHDNRPENLSVLDGSTHQYITLAERATDRDLLAKYIERYGPLE